MSKPDAARRSGGIRLYDGAVAVVTGGASGIGRALAEAMAARGARVVLADRQVELAREVASAIGERGGDAEAREVDVTDPDAVEELIAGTLDRHRRLDLLFNNAGIGIGGDVRLYQRGDWDRLIDVNLRGVTNGVQAAYPRMLEQGFGHLVNTASMAGLTASPGLAGYAATKHAVIGLSKSLRIEAAPLGVRVSALCPGVIRTPILDGGRYGALRQEMPPAVRERMVERLRPMEPRRFAAQVLAAVARNRAIIIVPRGWRVAWWLERLCPGLSMRLTARMHRRMLATLEGARKE